MFLRLFIDVVVRMMFEIRVQDFDTDTG